MVHENWFESKRLVEKIDGEIRALYVKLESGVGQTNDVHVRKEIEKKQAEKARIAREPKWYADTVTQNDIQAAIHSGAYFWAEFSARARLPEGLGSAVAAANRAAKKLAFVHITKTAGTSIEELGWMHGVYWGRHDPHMRRLTYGLPNRGSEFWHVPAKYYREDVLKEVLERADLFAVMRDPVDRVISEYYCKWGGPQRGPRQGGPQRGQRDGPNQRGQPTPASINQWIKERLETELANLSGRFTYGHWVPQYMYLYDKHGRQIVADENIVLFERLHEDMNRLLARYGYPFRMEDVEVLNRNAKVFTRDDLTKENLELIHKVYSADFQKYDEILNR
jgi:hypothetical protein